MNPRLVPFRSLLLLLALPAAVLLGTYLWGTYAHSATSVAGPGTQGQLVWSDGHVIFENKSEVAAWIRTHGGDFRTFARKHPAAVALLRQPTPSPATKRAATRSAAAKPTRVVAAARAGSIGTGGLAFALPGAIAALLFLLAFSPGSLLARLRLADPDNGAELLFVRGASAVAAALVVALVL